METKACHIKKVQMPNNACIPSAMNASGCKKHEYKNFKVHIFKKQQTLRQPSLTKTNIRLPAIHQ
jgi:hypothetical protein